jgi:hypothetical protein
MEPHMSRLSFSLGALVLAVAGCAEPAEVATSAHDLMIPDGVELWTSRGNVIPLCWIEPGDDDAKALVRDAIARTWATVAPITVVWSESCPTSGDQPAVRVNLVRVDDTGAAGGNAALGTSGLSWPTDPIWCPTARRRLAALPCGRAGPTARPGRAGRPPRRRAHRDPRVRPRPRLQPRAGSSRRAAVHGDRPHAGHLARSLRSGLGHELLRRPPHPPVGGRRRRGPGGLRERRRPDRRARRSRRRRPRRADRHQHQRHLRPALDRLRLHRLARVDLGLLRPARDRVRRPRRRRSTPTRSR